MTGLAKLLDKRPDLRPSIRPITVAGPCWICTKLPLSITSSVVHDVNGRPFDIYYSTNDLKRNIKKDNS
ncbi:protein of unknown function [Paenibacillus alvei]|uniref:Uncharacterized protein n=1 Tax=Paenibacillus alvei TaxID=44250 RepID=A0A383R810_PAEAL|nr:protein of unknown function [Paenibacillus alvei]